MSVEQEILALIELYIAGGTSVTRGLQQQDVTKRAVDEARKFHKEATLQVLAILLRRQSTEASESFVRGQALRSTREVALSPEKVYQTAQVLGKLIEAAGALRRPSKTLTAANSCAAAMAAEGAGGGGVEYLNTRLVKRVKRETPDATRFSLSPLNRPPTPGDEAGVFSTEEETDVEENEEKQDTTEEQETNFLDGLLSLENPPEL